MGLKLVTCVTLLLSCAALVSSTSLRATSESERYMFYNSFSSRVETSGVYATVMKSMDVEMDEILQSLDNSYVDRGEGEDGLKIARYETVLNSLQLTRWSTICSEGHSLLAKLKDVADILKDNTHAALVNAYLETLEEKEKEVCDRLLAVIAEATRNARDSELVYSQQGYLKKVAPKDLAEVRMKPRYIIVPGCVDPKESVLRAELAYNNYLQLPEEDRGRCKFVLSGMGFWKTEGAAEPATVTQKQQLAYMAQTGRVKAELSDEDVAELDISNVESVTEAVFMLRVIETLEKIRREAGEPISFTPSQIILDEEARDTVGNGVFSLLEIMKDYVENVAPSREEGIASLSDFLAEPLNVMLISSTYHVIRAHDFYARVFPQPWSFVISSVTVTQQWAKESDALDVQKLCTRPEMGKDLGALDCARSVSLSIQQNFLVEDKMQARFLWMNHVPLPEMLLHLTKNHPLYNGYHPWAANHALFMDAVKVPLMKLVEEGKMWPEPITATKEKIGKDLLEQYLAHDKYGPLVASHWAAAFDTAFGKKTKPVTFFPGRGSVHDISGHRGGNDLPEAETDGMMHATPPDIEEVDE